MESFEESATRVFAMLKEYSSTVGALGYRMRWLLEPSSHIVYRAVDESRDVEVVVKLPHVEEYSGDNEGHVRAIRSIVCENDFLDAMGETEGLASKHDYYSNGFRGKYPVLVRRFFDGQTFGRGDSNFLDGLHRPRLEAVIRKAHGSGFADIDISSSNVAVVRGGLANFFDLFPRAWRNDCTRRKFSAEKRSDWERFDEFFK